jgi:hypothetical protein
LFLSETRERNSNGIALCLCLHRTFVSFKERAHVIGTEKSEVAKINFHKDTVPEAGQVKILVVFDFFDFTVLLVPELGVRVYKISDTAAYANFKAPGRVIRVGAEPNLYRHFNKIHRQHRLFGTVRS